MKKLILCFITSLALNGVNAQCETPVSSVTEAFGSASMPTCWTPSGSAAIASGQLTLTSYGGSSALVVLPMTDNCRGILSFDAARVWNYEISSVQVGVVSAPNNLGSWTLLTTVGTYYTMTNFTVDLSGYTGNYQYLVLRLQSLSTGNPSRKCTIDNVNYTSGCMSTAVSATTQDVSVQLDNTGYASLLPSQVDNGSNSTCGTLSLSLDRSSFGCSDVGTQQVELTATDNNGNSASAFANVTVFPAINDETLFPNNITVCDGTDVNIATASSVSGINYYLRDDATDAIIDGPVVGTGGSISFSTGALSSNASYNVFAETPGAPVPTYALDLDGSNDIIRTDLLIPASTAFTIETMIFPRSTNYDRIITSFLGSGSLLAGDFVLDTYDPTYNNGRGLRLVMAGPSAVSYTLNVSNVLNLNVWNHVAVVFDNGNIKFYVNGNEVANGTAPYVNYPGSTNYIAFGEDYGGTTPEFLNGKLDEIRIWTSARSQTDIDVNQDTCLEGNETNLFAYFPFEEGTGTTVENKVTALSYSWSNMDASDWTSGSYSCEYIVDGLCSIEMSTKVDVTVADLAPVPDVASLPQLTNPCEVTSLITAMATDACSGTITGTHDAILPITSSTTLTWTFDDGSGNISTQTQDVLIVPWDYSITDNFGTIEAATTGLASYQWVDCNDGNAAIPGATDETFVPQNNGSYALVTSDGTCEFTSNCVLYNTAGLNTHSTIASPLVIPNPGNERVEIINTQGLINVIVRDLQGKEIMNGLTTVLDFTDQAPALYLIEINDARGTQVLRFVRN